MSSFKGAELIYQSRQIKFPYSPWFSLLLALFIVCQIQDCHSGHNLTLSIPAGNLSSSATHVLDGKSKTCDFPETNFKFFPLLFWTNGNKSLKKDKDCSFIFVQGYTPLHTNARMPSPACSLSKEIHKTPAYASVMLAFSCLPHMNAVQIWWKSVFSVRRKQRKEFLKSKEYLYYHSNALPEIRKRHLNPALSKAGTWKQSSQRFQISDVSSQFSPENGGFFATFKCILQHQSLENCVFRWKLSIGKISFLRSKRVTTLFC